MPVSRNLSLPSSIEARKFKKRPEDLCDLKHCFSMPCTSLNINSNNSSETRANVKGGKCGSPLQFHSSNTIDLNASAPSFSQGFSVDIEKSRSPTACRGTLSQPCLSEPANVGPTSIFPHLFLGSQEDVNDKEMLTDNNITNVLNVSCTCARPEYLDDDHFRRIAVRDNYQEKITPHLDEAVNFIEAARKKHERVLVHCLAGVSRSATVAIAYVMYYLRLNFDDAYRFVKDKRPTISPNFNFLGQLMEFEKTLHKRGHMSKPRTGSIPSDDDYKAQTKSALQSKANPTLSEVTKTVPKFFVTLPVSDDKEVATTAATQGSAVCRRRKGPPLEKLSFVRSTSHQSLATKKCEDVVGSVLHTSMTTPGGAGVVLDLCVTGPPSELHSKRLGSDGVEDGEEDAPDHTLDSTPFDLHRMFQKSNSLPRCMTGFVMDDTRQVVGPFRCNTAHATPTTSLFTNDEQLFLRNQDNLRSSTAPNTPAVLRLDGINTQSEMNVMLATEELLFPNDVVMTQVDNEAEISPPSPPSRFRSLTDPSTLFINSSCSFEQRNNYMAVSPRPDRFVSRKTRSPKVLKRSFNPNSRPSYGYQALRNTKQQIAQSSQTPVLFRARTRESPPPVVRGTEDALASRMQCDSPGADVSSLTLNSPVVMQSDPMEAVGKKCVLTNSKSDSCLPRNTFPTSCTNTKTTGLALNVTSRTSDAAPSYNKTESFKLVSSSELKPRWRNKHRSPKVTVA